VVASLIAQFRSEIHGQLSDRRRVMDHLLDLRLSMQDQPAVVAEVDRLLGELPGLTTVENEWWGDGIDALERALETVATP
jgi:hypothetical protein